MLVSFFVSGNLPNPGYTAHPAFRVPRTLYSQHEAKAGQRNLQSVTITHHSLQHDAFWSELIQISG